MTKFEKLNEAIQNMNKKNLAPIVDREEKIQNQNTKMHRVELISADPFEFTDIVNSSRRKMLRPRRIFATALTSSNSRRRVRLIVVVVVETQF